MPFSRSLLHPALLDRDWWDGWEFPSRIRHQNFGVGLMSDDFFQPSSRIQCHRDRQQERQVSTRGTSEVRNDKGKFQVTLDVSHFKPEELCVKTVDNCVLIHGKHDEKRDDHGFVQREFTRRYVLPQDIEPEKVTSSLSADGYLVVEAARQRPEFQKPNERNVPIAIRSSSTVNEKFNDLSSMDESLDSKCNFAD